MSELTHARLLSLVSYDPLTGAFTRLCRASSNAPAGPVKTTAHDRGYRTLCVAGRRYFAHRLAWFYMTGKWPEAEADHRDGNRANNVFKNLREASSTLNKQNVRKAPAHNTSSGLLGASWCRGRWQALIKVDGKPKYLGRFDTAEAAHQAYLQAKRSMHAGCTI